MLPKHVRYQTAPQSDIFDRTPWLTSYVRALLNAISSDSGTVLSQYHDAFILILRVFRLSPPVFLTSCETSPSKRAT